MQTRIILVSPLLQQSVFITVCHLYDPQLQRLLLVVVLNIEVDVPALLLVVTVGHQVSPGRVHVSCLPVEVEKSEGAVLEEGELKRKQCCKNLISSVSGWYQPPSLFSQLSVAAAELRPRWWKPRRLPGYCSTSAGYCRPTTTQNTAVSFQDRLVLILW